MITQQLRKVGNSYVITIPKAAIDRLQATEGVYLAADFTRLEMKPALAPELRDFAERNHDGLVQMMRYLKDK